MANCGRMVRDSAMITEESRGNQHCSFEWYDRWLLLSPFPQNGGSKCIPCDFKFWMAISPKWSSDPLHVSL